MAAERGKVRSIPVRHKPVSPSRDRAHLQAFIDCFDDELIIVGSDFRVKRVNAAVARRLGKKPRDIIGLKCYKIIHDSEEPCLPPWRECPLKQVTESGKPARVIHTHRESSQSEDITEKWVELFLSPIDTGKDKSPEVIEMVRDVSENRKLKKEALRSSRELLAVSSISRALNRTLDLKATLRAAADGMLDALEAQLSWIQLSDDMGKLPTAWSSRLKTGISEELMETISNMRSSKEVTTSATYSIIPGDDSGEQTQALWQFAVTPLKSKNVVLGRAGVATTRRPVDQQRIELLETIGHQIAVAIERCRLYEEVEAARDTLGRLLHQIITTQEEERKRIARELHDETGQALFALRLSLENLAVTPVASKEEIKSHLKQSLSLCQQADEEVDKLIFDLRPALLDDLGLVPAIEFYSQTRLKTTGTALSLTVKGKTRRLTGEKEVALFRVVQESINNIVKHAQAKNVAISLKFTRNRLVAVVKDDGIGFDLSHAMSSRDPKCGFGLLGMKERLSLVKGSLDIVSRPGAGTRITAIVPLEQEEEK